MTTVLELVNEAYKIIGIYSEDRPLEGSRAEEGLETLNKLVDGLAAKSEYIAFNNKLEFDLVVGQRTYELSNDVGADVASNRLISIKSCSLTFNNNLYSVEVKSDSDFYKTDRNLGVTGRPTFLFLQNNVGRSEVTFFAKPDRTYTATIIGRFILNSYSHLTDEIENVPLYFIQFLESALARRLREKYPNTAWAPLNEKRYQELFRDITQISDKPDMRIRNADTAGYYSLRNLYT